MDLTFLDSGNCEIAGDLIDQYAELVCGAFGQKKSLKAYNGLISDMLYNHSVVYVIGLAKSKEGKPIVVCGAKLIFDYKVTHSAYCLHIEDVCVAEEFRGRGICTKLVNHIKAHFNTASRPIYKFHLYCLPSLMELYAASRLLVTNSIVMEERI